MKKIAIIIALLLFQTQLATMAAYNKKPAKKTAAVSSKSVQKPADTASTYLLKYNIDDLEAAPWLNGGKRVYKK